MIKAKIVKKQDGMWRCKECTEHFTFTGQDIFIDENSNIWENATLIREFLKPKDHINEFIEYEDKSTNTKIKAKIVENKQDIGWLCLQYPDNTPIYIAENSDIWMNAKLVGNPTT